MRGKFILCSSSRELAPQLINTTDESDMLSDLSVRLILPFGMIIGNY
jgi:hypothetical protein